MARIVIADDESILLLDQANELKRLGHQVVGTAANGPQAVKLARETRPDLVILDIRMPGNYDGIGAADIIKKDPGVVAEVLKIVNSAYYGLSTEIGNVSHAVAYMGINEVYRIVLSIAVFKNLDCDDIEAFNQVWFHSFLTALSAKFLAEKFEPLLPIE